jgi:hypothetical protein
MATIGNAGTGTFSQTNGTATFSGGLTVAAARGGTGIVNLYTLTSAQSILLGGSGIAPRAAPRPARLSMLAELLAHHLPSFAHRSG